MKNSCLAQTNKLKVIYKIGHLPYKRLLITIADKLKGG